MWRMHKRMPGGSDYIAWKSKGGPYTLHQLQNVSCLLSSQGHILPLSPMPYITWAGLRFLVKRDILLSDEGVLIEIEDRGIIR